MYVYDCNGILTTAVKNRSDKEMIRAFTSLTEDLKILGIHPGFHFMDNEASTALNLTTMTINIKYQLLPPSKHTENKCREGNTNIQEPMYSGTVQCRKIFSSSIVG